jgi:molybdopterin-containing oxidoreductase family iron-sulfur binding subunit
VVQTDDTMMVACVQNHAAMDQHDRDLVHVAPVANYEKLTPEEENPRAGQPGERERSYPLSLLKEYNYEHNKWGMVIDQNACIGCNACVIACVSENNIPVVGKDQVARGREMHWLRVDNYWGGNPEQSETVEGPYFQPLPCMHCEKAPCELVCPVNATVHDAEGTNNMVYNRCVGTRYCSNNCPYKVRHFNFLAYNDYGTEQLKMQRNPDVTVRSRGVMEKCSYCIQRINHARIDAKKGFVNGERDNDLLKYGEVFTACQQACPTQAIIFGNLNDRTGEVAKLSQEPVNYTLLEELQTQPRTTYLPRFTNPAKA